MATFGPLQVPVPSVWQGADAAGQRVFGPTGLVDVRVKEDGLPVDLARVTAVVDRYGDGQDVRLVRFGERAAVARSWRDGGQLFLTYLVSLPFREVDGEFFYPEALVVYAFKDCNDPLIAQIRAMLDVPVVSGGRIRFNDAGILSFFPVTVPSELFVVDDDGDLVALPAGEETSEFEIAGGYLLLSSKEPRDEFLTQIEFSMALARSSDDVVAHLERRFSTEQVVCDRSSETLVAFDEVPVLRCEGGLSVRGHSLRWLAYLWKDGLGDYRRLLFTAAPSAWSLFQSSLRRIEVSPA